MRVRVFRLQIDFGLRYTAPELVATTMSAIQRLERWDNALRDLEKGESPCKDLTYLVLKCPSFFSPLLTLHAVFRQILVMGDRARQQKLGTVDRDVLFQG